MTMKALVRTADSSLVRIDNFADDVGTKPGLTLMDFEYVTANSATTAYTQTVVTQAVVGGKWQITTTTTDLTGTALATAKSGMVSAADFTLAEGERWLLNGLYAVARISSPTMTQVQFLTALANAQNTTGTQGAITRTQMLGLLAGLI